MLDRNLMGEIRRIHRDWQKMVFLSGPRQVGKTTLAEELLRRTGGGVYVNWDVITDRRKLSRDPYFFEKLPHRGGGPRLLVFDEIHKYARWKSYLKGVYDAFRNDVRVLVTGSGRLDLFKKGGDSLLGRYVSLPLFPLTVGELLGKRSSWDEFHDAAHKPGNETEEARTILDRLLKFGGFPEPYLKQDERFLRVWRNSRTHLLVHEDIRDATNLRRLSLLEMLVHLLEPRVGSPLSINNLREDLEVAFDTVREWLQVLSDFYVCWRVQPYSRRLARALRKEAKLYFYDWTEIQDPAIRFENLVALHLQKACAIWSSLGEASPELYYVRDKEKREVDFLLVESERPLLLVECKAADEHLSPHLLYYQERLDVPVAVQLLLEKGHEEEYRRGGRRQWLVSADRWLQHLP